MSVRPPENDQRRLPRHGHLLYDIRSLLHEVFGTVFHRPLPQVLIIRFCQHCRVENQFSNRMCKADATFHKDEIARKIQAETMKAQSIIPVQKMRN